MNNSLKRRVPEKSFCQPLKAIIEKNYLTLGYLKSVPFKRLRRLEKQKDAGEPW